MKILLDECVDQKLRLLVGPCAFELARRPWRCTIYIVRRTQLYLDDSLWEELHARAKRENTTISELVRQAVRERYIGSHEQRLLAMHRFVGSRKPRAGETNAVDEVRRLRTGSRMERWADR